MKRLKRIVLPDAHIPFHDKPIIKAWLDFVREEEPDGIDIIGDLLDCYSLSRFDKNPHVRRAGFSDEVEQGREMLEKIREAVPEAEIRYSEGNHEQRLTRLLWGPAKELAELRGMSIPEILGLDDLNIHWHTLGDPYKIRDLWYTHGALIRKNGGMTAKATSDKIEGSVMIGHTHRMGFVPTTSWKGIRCGYEAGHLANYKDLDYIDGIPQWQQGWAVVHFLPNGHHQVEFVEMRNVTKTKRALIYRGEEIWRGRRTKRTR